MLSTHTNANYLILLPDPAEQDQGPLLGIYLHAQGGPHQQLDSEAQSVQ